jgi:RNA polymerase sigma-70 factor (ECF subfamily)
MAPPYPNYAGIRCAFFNSGGAANDTSMEKIVLNEQFLELLTSHQKRLAGYLRMLVPNRIDAEEVFQETNLYICRHADDFQLGTDFSAWVLKVAHFCVLTWRERRSRDRLTFDDSLLEQLATSAQTAINRSDRRRDALEACLDKIPPQDRSLVMQLYNDPEMTPQGLAAMVGRSTKGIYESLTRIRLRLLDCVRRTLAAEDRS